MLTNKDLDKLRRSRKLKEIFKSFDVELAYLYGSQLTNYTHKGSDIDIAIRFKKDVPKDEYFDRRLSIMTPLGRYFKKETDVVVFDQVPLLLRYVATCEGRYIYEDEKYKHVDFDVKIMREFSDFEPFLRELNQKYLYA